MAQINMGHYSVEEYAPGYVLVMTSGSKMHLMSIDQVGKRHDKVKFLCGNPKIHSLSAHNPCDEKYICKKCLAKLETLKIAAENKAAEDRKIAEHFQAKSPFNQPAPTPAPKQPEPTPAPVETLASLYGEIEINRASIAQAQQKGQTHLSRQLINRNVELTKKLDAMMKPTIAEILKAGKQPELNEKAAGMLAKLKELYNQHAKLSRRMERAKHYTTKANIRAELTEIWDGSIMDLLYDFAAAVGRDFENYCQDSGEGTPSVVEQVFGLKSY
jgi:hypothetical protein